MERTASIKRTTKETDISLSLNLDGTGNFEISTGIGFFDHMLSGFAKHGYFDLDLKAKGDLEVDGHHTVEDCGIVLGNAIAKAVGDKKGINRYGYFVLPMDEALIMVAVDISGRSGVYFDLNIPTEKVGDFDTELCKEFYIAFAREAGITLHIRQLAGENSHHIIEGVFKAVGRVMREACSIDERAKDQMPSTKGML